MQNNATGYDNTGWFENPDGSIIMWLDKIYPELRGSPFENLDTHSSCTIPPADGQTRKAPRINTAIRSPPQGFVVSSLPHYRGRPIRWHRNTQIQPPNVGHLPWQMDESNGCRDADRCGFQARHLKDQAPIRHAWRSGGHEARGMGATSLIPQVGHLLQCPKSLIPA